MQGLATGAESLIRSVGGGSLGKEFDVRRAVVFSLLLAMSLVVAGPASAGPGSNPNAEFIADLACDDGTEAELVIAVGRAGHNPAGPLAGVATSIWVLDGPNGTRLLSFFDVPGAGLEGLTTFCWWFDGTEGVWIGADVLLHPSLR
jgi:hypothetical protein